MSLAEQIMEIVGYSCRLVSHYHPFVVNYFVVQYFFVVVSPVFFVRRTVVVLPFPADLKATLGRCPSPACLYLGTDTFLCQQQAAFYLALGLALRRLDHRGSTLLGFNPKILISVMIASDVVTTIIQIAGAALIGVAESDQYQGKKFSLTSSQANNILLAGLAIQMASFFAFLCLLVFVIVRSERTFTAAHLPRRFSTFLFTASLLVFLRTTFRLAETAQGVFGPASRSEALFGTLEYLPVILAVGLYAAVPLAELLPVDVDDDRYETSSDARTLSMRQATKETRTLDLRGASTRGSDAGRNGNGASSDEEKEIEAGDLERASEVSPSSPASSTSGAGEGGRRADELRETDEDEGVVTDESPTTMVEHGSLRSRKGSGIERSGSYGGRKTE